MINKYIDNDNLDDGDVEINVNSNFKIGDLFFGYKIAKVFLKEVANKIRAYINVEPASFNFVSFYPTEVMLRIAKNTNFKIGDSIYLDKDGLATNLQNNSSFKEPVGILKMMPNSGQCIQCALF